MKTINLLLVLLFSNLFVMSQDLVINEPAQVQVFKNPIFPGCSTNDSALPIEVCFNNNLSNIATTLFNSSSVDMPACDYVYVPVTFDVNEEGKIVNVSSTYMDNDKIKNETINAVNRVNDYLASKEQKIKPAMTENGNATTISKQMKIALKGKGTTKIQERKSKDGSLYMVFDQCGNIMVYKGQDIYHKTLFKDYNSLKDFNVNFEKDFTENEKNIEVDEEVLPSFKEDEIKIKLPKRANKKKAEEDLTKKIKESQTKKK